MSKLSVRVNSAEQNGTALDEVFVTSDTSEKSKDPYVNRVIYAKPGLFKDGEISVDAVSKLESESKETLDKEHAAKLAQEAKEREAAVEPAKPKAGSKKEG